MVFLATLVALLSVQIANGAENTTSSRLKVPQQSVFLDPHSFAVLGSNGSFRNASELFNPTVTPPPIFQVFSSKFLPILGSSPSIRVIAMNASFAFAHEAPIWFSETDEVFFASSDGGPLGFSDLNHNNQVSKISLRDPQIAKGGLATVTKIPLGSDIQMTNGGTNFRGELLLVNSGRGDLPPNLAHVNPRVPFNSTIILDNFFGRQFNSLNDVKIHPKSGKIFFTDCTFGFLLAFRPAPQLPNQVYRFDPDTGVLRVVADGFVIPNGIAFTADGNTAYVSDTGEDDGSPTEETAPSTIYAFDVDPTTQAFKNRRVFAYADTGIPDGIQLDTEGNVYSGTGDGVQVWSPDGELIGKVFLGTTSANMIFAGKGRLVIMAETAVFLASIAATGIDLNSF